MNHWAQHSAQWSRLTSPLRPCEEDLALFQQALDHYGPDDSGRCLLLGVTPELAAFARPLTAVEINAGVIRALAAESARDNHVVQADWRALPFAAASFSRVLGDGSFNNLEYPRDYQRLFAELRNVMMRGAVLATRVFVAPEYPDSLESLRLRVHDQKSAGSFHAFKWRLAMAWAAENASPNVPVNSIYEAFSALFPDRDKLAALTGWAPQDVATIEVYVGSAIVYSFPTLAQLRMTLPDWITERNIAWGSYELAERCPVIAFSMHI